MLHKHIVKHAKRAHAHVQDHGHKWLWLLSWVFFFILIYPYFSNAQGTWWAMQDICTNGDNSPSLYDCICDVGGESSEEICPIQEESEEPTDLCPNIDEVQEQIPEWYELDEEGDCIEIEEEAIVDVCTNIDGIQETVPEGQELNNDNECVPVEQVTICEDEEANNFEQEGACTFDIPEEVVDPITAIVTYSPTSGTNTTGNVVATVTWFSTTGVTVTSSGWATYTFIENGSHTFTFENEDGATGSVVASVDWIAPVQLTTTIQECEIIVQTPTSGSIVAGSFDITWSADNCNDEEAVTIQLRDHNNQRINIGTWILEDEEFSFNSTWLASTGFYTITGLHLSGTSRQETSGGVVVASGVYTQDTVYNMYTWAYAGVYTNYATGYKLRLVDENGDVFAESNGTFTIDNQKPVLSNFIVSFAPLVSGQVGRSGIMTASFTSNEQLTGWVTFTILGTTVVPTSGSVSGNTYTYTIPLTSVVASGALTFTANVADLAANTWSLYGTSATVLNNRIPAINNFMFTTGTVSGSINLSWKTDVATKYNLSYYKSGTAGTTYFTGTTYGTSHTYTMANIQNNNHYPFAITVLDNLSNNNTLQGVLYKSATGSLSISLQSSNDILQLSWQAEANLYLQILQNEINKFQTCKAALTFTNQNIPVANKTVTLKIPTIQNNGVKQTMLAFLLLFTNKVKDKTTLSQVELNTVADAVNNFLVIIKLVDDNGNSCDQKMSTYYLSQFEQLMSSMNFF